MARRLGPNTPLGIRKVHVGCGPHAILPDWWNVDIRSFLGIDEVIDATAPWPSVKAFASGKPSIIGHATALASMH
jgi:hypothetical protein